MIPQNRFALMSLVVAIVASSIATRSGTAGTVIPAIPDTARPLPPGAVRLTGGPLKNAQDLNARILLALEPDMQSGP